MAAMVDRPNGTYAGSPTYEDVCSITTGPDYKTTIWNDSGACTYPYPTNPPRKWVEAVVPVIHLYPIRKRGLFFKTKKDMMAFFTRESWRDLYLPPVTTVVKKSKYVKKLNIGLVQKKKNKRKFYIQSL